MSVADIDSAALPVIGITQGDPAGIGPELCLRILREPEVLRVCRPVLFGDLHVLRQVGARLGLPLPSRVLSPDELFSGKLGNAPEPTLVDCRMILQDIEPGRATREAGAASYAYIEASIRAALGGVIHGVTTAPITKAAMNMAGVKEPGHTEIFGRLTDCANFAMMLYSPRLAVSFVTCHQSLESVPASLSIEKIRRVTALTGETLRKIRGREPRLAVLGLNPHAGEQGMFGSQDEELIRPAIGISRAEGWQVEGPLSPDAAFMPRALERYDGHVTMYHDQGSIPFKMISLHDGVNITMGLPIIRTSVDHGTAYDIAWRGVAELSSFISAVQLAARLAMRD